MKKGFVGTYSEHLSEGIYQFHIDETSGTLGEVSLFAPLTNAKYLAMGENVLFSLYDDETESGVAVFDMSGTLLTKTTFESSTSCYLLVSGNDIYTSHYHLGTVSHLIYDPEEKSLKYQGNTFIAEKAGSHQVIPHGDLLYVPCLHLDVVKIFSRNLEEQGEIPMPTGSGCRHGVVSPDGQYLYVLGELSNQVYTVALSTKQVLGQVNLLPEGEVQNHGGAALRLSEDGKRLYASIREPQNRITVLSVEGSTCKVSHSFVVEGSHPRDILHVCGEKYLLVAMRGTDQLHSFSIETAFSLVNTVKIPAGISIVMA